MFDYSNQRAEVEQQAITNLLDEAIEVLRSVEWVERDPDPRPCYGECPSCGATATVMEDGRYVGLHYDRCKLGDFLRRMGHA